MVHYSIADGKFVWFRLAQSGTKFCYVALQGEEIGWPLEVHPESSSEMGGGPTILVGGAAVTVLEGRIIT